MALSTLILSVFISFNEPCHEKTCFSHMRATKVDLRSLISTFVVCCLDSIISLVFISEISSLSLASVAEQDGLSLTRSKKPMTGFFVTSLKYSQYFLQLVIFHLPSSQRTVYHQDQTGLRSVSACPPPHY